MNILMLGSDTSLGKVFTDLAMREHHRIWDLSEEACQHHNAIPAEVREHALEAGHFDWIVNCYGRNRLYRIGETPYLLNTNNPPFTASLLVENVMPIYWTVDVIVRLGYPIPPPRVLNVASQTYRIAQTHTAIYCASKAALVQMTKTMARELAPYGWVINCLAPGKIADTRMAELTDVQVQELRGWTQEEADAYALRNIPMKRYTTCAEVCDAMFKVLDLPPYINGTCIDMTGGA